MKLLTYVALVYPSVFSMGSNDVASLLKWIDESPTPFHVVETTKTILLSNGFQEQNLLGEDLYRKGFLIQDGAIIAWSLGDDRAPFRIIGAHTDSPNLRIQPHPDISAAGWSQLGIEIYGGVLLNSWLDRDLGIAGRIVCADGSILLFSESTAIARVPQLAIHLDREIGERGLLLDKQMHTVPVWGTNAPTFTSWLQKKTGRDDIVSYDAHLFDVTPGTILGVDDSLIASARLDNQLSCWAAIEALVATDSDFNSIVVLNDHEEVGSESVTGAAGPLLESVVDRILESQGVLQKSRFDHAKDSWCLSADNAHAVHPNYQERHDPRHGPRVNAGPALKLNGNQRYATTARGAAHIRMIAQNSGTPLQTFVSRNNMPCGSTIGPITSTRLGIEAIDIGVPQLSMHSAREMCGAEDPKYLVSLMRQFLVN
jgi:aspartyl aminopeptidase